jgi:hypothetical protein
MQATAQLDIQPVTTERFEDLAALFRTGLARVCWDMEPRQTAAEDAACRGCWPTTRANRSGGCRSASEATTHASCSRGPYHRWTT